MNILERLLQDLQERGEIEGKTKALAAAKAAREAKAVADQQRNAVDEDKTRQLVVEQNIKDALERYSAIQRLKAVRDGVWKVGKIKPSGDTYNSSDWSYGGNVLVHTYPAAIPIMKPITHEIQYRESPASSGGGETKTGTIGGRAFTGYYREGRGFDAVVIKVQASGYEVPKGSSDIIFHAGGGFLGPESEDNEPLGYHTDKDGFYVPGTPEGNRLFTWHYISPEARFNGGRENNYPFYLDEGEIHLTSPSYLERIMTDYCYGIIKNNQLPTQMEAAAQRKLTKIRQAGKIRI